MKPNDTISILVCVHSQDVKHDNMLVRALNSLARQTYTDFDTVIVLNDCWEHTENRVDLFQTKLHITKVHKPVKDGLATAKNVGLKYCVGDWVGFIDGDDQILPEKLEKQVEFLRANPRIDVLGTQAFDLYPDGTLTNNCFLIGDFNDHDQIARELITQNCLCHGSLLIRKSKLDAVGGYCEGKGYKGLEDWASWIRMLRHGARFAVLRSRQYIYSMGTGVER